MRIWIGEDLLRKYVDGAHGKKVDAEWFAGVRQSSNEALE
jgi:hypothetical protein